MGFTIWYVSSWFSRQIWVSKKRQERCKMQSYPRTYTRQMVSSRPTTKWCTVDLFCLRLILTVFVFSSTYPYNDCAFFQIGAHSKTWLRLVGRLGFNVELHNFPSYDDEGVLTVYEMLLLLAGRICWFNETIWLRQVSRPTCAGQPVISFSLYAERQARSQLPLLKS